MGYIEEGEYCLQMCDFGRARKCYGYARREDKNDWRAWFGLARVVTKNFTSYTGENWAMFVNTAINLTTPENINYINSVVGDYPQRYQLLKNMRR
jgi:hypothetical protein